MPIDMGRLGSNASPECRFDVYSLVRVAISECWEGFMDGYVQRFVWRDSHLEVTLMLTLGICIANYGP